MEEMKYEMVDYLSRRRFLTLATSDKKGVPFIHPIAYVNKGQNVYFSTDKQTRKVKNIQENPNVAYTVYDDTEHFDEIRFIQVEGIASIVDDDEKLNEVLEMLDKKFPFMKNAIVEPDTIAVKIVPKIGYYSDYNKRFGKREKIKF